MTAWKTKDNCNDYYCDTDADRVRAAPPVSPKTTAISQAIEEARKKQEQPSAPEMERIEIPRISVWLEQRITARIQQSRCTIRD